MTAHGALTAVLNPRYESWALWELDESTGFLPRKGQKLPSSYRFHVSPVREPGCGNHPMLGANTLGWKPGPAARCQMAP